MHQRQPHNLPVSHARHVHIHHRASFQVSFNRDSPAGRLLKDDHSFSFVPRSRLELPENFPKEIPGTCYFLEAGTSHSHASLTSSRSAPPTSMRKVSYSIGTMFLRETSL